MYFKIEDGLTALVLIYMDDVLCATSQEEFKNSLFAEPDREHSTKDQGVLTNCSDAEIYQTDDSFFIQKKYASEILKKFGYTIAH